MLDMLKMKYSTYTFCIVFPLAYLLSLGEDFFTLGESVSFGFDGRHASGRGARESAVGSKGSSERGGQRQGTAGKSELHLVVSVCGLIDQLQSV